MAVAAQVEVLPQKSADRVAAVTAATLLALQGLPGKARLAGIIFMLIVRTTQWVAAVARVPLVLTEHG